MTYIYELSEYSINQNDLVQIKKDIDIFRLEYMITNNIIEK